MNISDINYTKPLRAIVIIAFTVGIWTCVIMGKLEIKELAYVYTSLISFLFGERSALKNPVNGGK